MIALTVAWMEVALVLGSALIAFLVMGYILRDVLKDGKKGKGWNGSS